MKTISGDKVIDLVYRDMRPSDSDWVGDAWDMIGEAIGFIGYHVGWDKKYVDLTVSSHRVTVPSYMQKIYHVKYNGKRVPLAADSSAIELGSKSEDTMSTYDPYRLEEIDKLVQQVENLEEMKLNTSDPTTLLEIEELITEKNKEIRKLASELSVNVKDTAITGKYYSINPAGNIQTSFASGDIRVFGLCSMLDDRGVPLVVGTTKYLDACKYYIGWKLAEQGYKHPLYSGSDLMSLWGDARHSAANEFKMRQTIDNQDRFAKMWTRFKFDPEASVYFMKNLEQ